MAAKEPRALPDARRAKPRRPTPDTGARRMNDIRLLAKMLSRYDLSELEVEHQGQRIRLRRERLAGVPGVALAPATPAPFATTQTASAAPKPEPAEDGTALITSPFVGTFYRSPTPEGTPFVEIGQTAKKGHVLCIVEAMKLMNEIEADTTCKILDILVKNGDPVEFGQPLFKITPLA